jgi:hypothetical protein
MSTYLAIATRTEDVQENVVVDNVTLVQPIAGRGLGMGQIGWQLRLVSLHILRFFDDG